MSGSNAQAGTPIGNGIPAGGDVSQPKPGAAGSPPANGGTPPDETNSQQWAALVRREQALTKQAQDLKASEAALKEREAKLGPIAEAFEKHKDNPQELLKALGIQLPAAQPEKPQTAEDRLMAIEERFNTWEENLKKREAEIRDQTNQSQLAVMEEKYVNELRGIVDKAPEKFEMVKALNSHALALAVQRQHWAASGGVGQPLTPDEALGMVEEYLREEYADKLIGTSYLKGKLTPPTPPTDGTKPPEKPSPGLKTLTNNSPGAPDEQPLPLTSDERFNKLVEKRFGPKPPTPKAKPKGK